MKNITIDSETNERIFHLRCDCGKKDGEVRFPEKHGRGTDDALEDECAARYSHVCDTCCCKDDICEKHKLGRIIEPDGQVRPITP